MTLRKGVYQHYKGQQYEVVGVAKHEGSLADMVIYKPLYANAIAELFVRPLSEFTEVVEREAYRGPRFVFISEVAGNSELT